MVLSGLSPVRVLADENRSGLMSPHPRTPPRRNDKGPQITLRSRPLEQMNQPLNVSAKDVHRVCIPDAAMSRYSAAIIAFWFTPPSASWFNSSSVFFSSSRVWRSTPAASCIPITSAQAQSVP